MPVGDCFGGGGTPSATLLPCLHHNASRHAGRTGHEGRQKGGIRKKEGTVCCESVIPSHSPHVFGHKSSHEDPNCVTNNASVHPTMAISSPQLKPTPYVAIVAHTGWFPIGIPKTCLGRVRTAWGGGLLVDAERTKSPKACHYQLGHHRTQR